MDSLIDNTEMMERAQRLKTQMETFDNLTVIGTRDEINEHEHRLKHFHVKVAEIFKEKVLNLRVSIVQDKFFCCVVTRYAKNTFFTDQKFVDKLITGEEPVTERLTQLIQGENS